MNILVTGGAGFIGSVVSKKLLDYGHSVIIADNLSTGSKENLCEKADFVKIDICSKKLEEIFKQNKIDAVFHFAAQTGVIEAAKNPEKDAQNNILGSINLFSLCKRYNVNKLTVHSSAAVYGTPKYLPIDEQHPLNPLSFYGLSKLMMEKYLQLFDINYVILRPSNVYALSLEIDNSSGVIKKFYTQMKNNETITIYGDGSQTRDFVHVEDIAEICRLTLELPQGQFIINASSSKEISISELFNIMSKRLDYSKTPVFEPANNCEIKESILDNSLMKELLSYEPKKNILKVLNSIV